MKSTSGLQVAVFLLVLSTSMLVLSTPVQRIPVTWQKISPSQGNEGNTDNLEFGTVLRNDNSESSDHMPPPIAVDDISAATSNSANDEFTDRLLVKLGLDSLRNRGVVFGHRSLRLQQELPAAAKRARKCFFHAVNCW